MQRADKPLGLAFALIQERCERSEELAHVESSLKSRVVVHEYEHAGQPSKRPAERDAGASAVSFGSWRRRDALTWSRRSRHMVASRGDITLTWCFDREACITMALAADDSTLESFRITLHTCKPELRPNGRDRRPPEAQGGDNMVSVLPKRHSVHVDSQSWLTDSSE
eukprot:569755-Pleurochrysis_carterae.AAC.3